MLGENSEDEPNIEYALLNIKTEKAMKLTTYKHATKRNINLELEFYINLY